MKYSVIRLAGQQHKVSEGDELLVNRLDEKPEVEILLVVDGEKVEVGRPDLKKAKVDVEVLGDEKGKKLYVQKYKAKSRYRKKIGFRSSFTRIRIKSIKSS